MSAKLGACLADGSLPPRRCSARPRRVCSGERVVAAALDSQAVASRAATEASFISPRLSWSVRRRLDEVGRGALVEDVAERLERVAHLLGRDAQRRATPRLRVESLAFSAAAIIRVALAFEARPAQAPKRSRGALAGGPLGTRAGAREKSVDELLVRAAVEVAQQLVERSVAPRPPAARPAAPAPARSSTVSSSTSRSRTAPSRPATWRRLELEIARRAHLRMRHRIHATWRACAASRRASA